MLSWEGFDGAISGAGGAELGALGAGGAVGAAGAFFGGASKIGAWPTAASREQVEIKP